MKDTILIVTDSEEPNIKRVVPFLSNEKVIRIDIDTFFENPKVEFYIGSENNWRFETSEGYASLDEVKSIWYRRPPFPKASSKILSQYHEFSEDESKKFLWALWIHPCNKEIFYMNDPLALKLLEFNKPYQLTIAQQVGLEIPETLITTNFETALVFFEKWNENIIMKIFGGSSVYNDQGQILSIFTNRVNREQLFAYQDGIRFTPTMFQNYIPKSLELRITVAGEKIFACAIHSQDSQRTMDDWRRYDFDYVKHESYILPDLVQKKIKAFMKILNLSFGAIDMILTPDGKYVFIEINPSGQWGWIENITKMPISEAIAYALANPTK